MFELFGKTEDENPVLTALEEDARRHPLLVRRFSVRRWLSVRLARLAQVLNPDPSFSERHALIAEWARHLPVQTVLGLTVHDFLTSTQLPDGTWRFMVAPTVSIPDHLRSRTRDWYGGRHRVAVRACHRAEVFLEPSGDVTTPEDLRRAGIAIRRD